ncbi:MAG: MATE family efflux transporter [Prevotella sp.]|nr:MATE family efflux transporter [Prevotella sp.]MCM1075703.1 MATE family efflux transporter [Ruminococcus sp.]
METIQQTSRFSHIYRLLFKLGLPVLVTQLGTIVVSMVDTMMVGDYGTRELASAAFVNNLFMVPIVMQMGFAGGVTPLIGALYGASKHTEAGSMLRVAIKLNVYLALIICAVMGSIFFALPYLGQPQELLPLIREYYLIVLISVLSGSLFFPTMQMAMGITDTVTPMLIIVCSNVLNCVGNYIFIFGHFGMPELGLNGAGLSTLSARILCSAAMVAVVFYGKRYRPYQSGLRTRAKHTSQHRKMNRTSIPTMIQAGVETALWGLGAVVSGWYGKEQLAAYQVVLVMGQLGFMTYMSFATATSIRIANLTGISDLQGIRHTCRCGLHLNLALATLASLTFILFGADLLTIFTPDTTVITLGIALIPPLVLYQYADAVQMTYVNALRGTSRVRPLIPISVISYLIVGAPVMLLLASGLGMTVSGVYYSFSVALLVAALLYIRAFRKVLRQPL